VVLRFSNKAVGLEKGLAKLGELEENYKSVLVDCAQGTKCEIPDNHENSHKLAIRGNNGCVLLFNGERANHLFQRL
jgi:hypothetical protein